MAQHDPKRFEERGDPSKNQVRCETCNCSGFKLEESYVGMEWRQDAKIVGGHKRSQLICEQCGEPLRISVKWQSNRRVF